MGARFTGSASLDCRDAVLATSTCSGRGVPQSEHGAPVLLVVSGIGSRGGAMTSEGFEVGLEAKSWVATRGCVVGALPFWCWPLPFEFVGGSELG